MQKNVVASTILLGPNLQGLGDPTCTQTVRKRGPNLHPGKCWPISCHHLWVWSTTSWDPMGAAKSANQGWLDGSIVHSIVLHFPLQCFVGCCKGWHQKLWQILYLWLTKDSRLADTLPPSIFSRIFSVIASICRNTFPSLVIIFPT